MKDVEALLRRYDRAIERNLNICARDPYTWHRPDVDEFTTLREQLTPFAESGDVRCQYALASIYGMGFCWENEEPPRQEYEAALQIATRWWVAAASQGHYYALDNLITCGVGAEADRVRKACRQFEEQRRDLVGRSHDMPVYGPDFMQELCKVIYGRVLPEED